MSLHEAPQGYGPSIFEIAAIALLGASVAGLWALRAGHKWLTRGIPYGR